MHSPRTLPQSRRRRRLVPPPPPLLHGGPLRDSGLSLIGAIGDDAIKREPPEKDFHYVFPGGGNDGDDGGGGLTRADRDEIERIFFDEREIMNEDVQAAILQSLTHQRREESGWPPSGTSYESFIDTYDRLRSDSTLTLEKLRVERQLPTLGHRDDGATNARTEKARQFVMAVLRSIDPKNPFSATAEWGLGERRLHIVQHMLDEENMLIAARNVNRAMLPMHGDIDAILKRGVLLEDMHIDAFLASLAVVDVCNGGSEGSSGLRSFAPFSLANSQHFLSAEFAVNRSADDLDDWSRAIIESLGRWQVTHEHNTDCPYNTLGQMIQTGRIAVPVNFGSGAKMAEGGSHYAVLLIDLARRHAFFMDPMPDPGGWRSLYAWTGFNTLMDIIEALDGRQRDEYGLMDGDGALGGATWDEWRAAPRKFSDPVARSGVPHQTDGASCGLFVCYYVWRWALGHPIDDDDEGGDRGLVPIVHDPACTTEYMDQYMRAALRAHLVALYRWSGMKLPTPSAASAQ